MCLYKCVTDNKVASDHEVVVEMLRVASMSTTINIFFHNYCYHYFLCSLVYDSLNTRVEGVCNGIHVGCDYKLGQVPRRT